MSTTVNNDLNEMSIEQWIATHGEAVVAAQRKAMADRVDKMMRSLHHPLPLPRSSVLYHLPPHMVACLRMPIKSLHVTNRTSVKKVVQ